MSAQESILLKENELVDFFRAAGSEKKGPHTLYEQSRNVIENTRGQTESLEKLLIPQDIHGINVCHLESNGCGRSKVFCTCH